MDSIVIPDDTSKNLGSRLSKLVKVPSPDQGKIKKSQFIFNLAWQSFFFNDIECVINLYNLRNGKFIIKITTFEALKYLLEAGYN